MLQTEALDILKMGKNVFLTGPAGSGKTHVLNRYVEYLKSHAVYVAVTASTGIAATHIGGMTIHSWSGLGIRDSLSDRDIDDMTQKQYLYKRFEKTKVLVIDEISMLHDFRLDLVEWVCRQMKHDPRPFGGMQVIVCGDFFQLPPVSRGLPTAQVGEILQNAFAYKSPAWQDSDFTICYLSEQYRQNDADYLSILNEIRGSRVTEKTVDLLRSRLYKDSHGGETTRLYTHNIDVDVVNKRHLDLIDSPTKKFQMSYKGAPSLVESLKKSCLSPEILELKVGARVMFTKNNIDGGYVNGTTGVVKEFNSYGDPVIETKSGKTFHVTEQSWKIDEDGKVKAEIMQLPLRLAWAITVHKSQGMSLDNMEVDLSKSFVRGMGYVALSRVRSLSGMKLLGFNEMSLLVDEEVLRMDDKFQRMSHEARAEVADMTRTELLEKQKSYLKTIEPEEKVKIKHKEKLLKKSTEDITADLLAEKLSLKVIADKRGLKQETIVSHIEDLVAHGKSPDFSYLRQEFKRGELDNILSAFKKAKTTTLSPIYNMLIKQKTKQSYLKIRLARLFLA